MLTSILPRFPEIKNSQLSCRGREATKPTFLLTLVPEEAPEAPADSFLPPDMASLTVMGRRSAAIVWSEVTQAISWSM